MSADAQAIVDAIHQLGGVLLVCVAGLIAVIYLTARGRRQ